MPNESYRYTAGSLADERAAQLQPEAGPGFHPLTWLTLALLLSPLLLVV